MKIRITLKDPDALIEAINDTVDNTTISCLNENEMEAVREEKKKEYTELAGRWFEYSEYVTLEIDTDNKTCVVVANE